MYAQEWSERKVIKCLNFTDGTLCLYRTKGRGWSCCWNPVTGFAGDWPPFAGAALAAFLRAV